MRYSRYEVQAPYSCGRRGYGPVFLWQGGAMALCSCGRVAVASCSHGRVGCGPCVLMAGWSVAPVFSWQSGLWPLCSCGRVGRGLVFLWWVGLWVGLIIHPSYGFHQMFTNVTHTKPSPLAL